MYLSLVALCLAAIVALYFYNNPLNHSRWFILRRFINWFPLGMTYGFLYMGRFNLTVSKNALGDLMPNRDFGLIFLAGAWTYALSFLINGPLVDKIGGKKGILIAAVGASAANIALGVLTYLVATQRVKVNLIIAFSVAYAVNMYFQSYGAVSIIKVKAYWFHVRERGVFGAIFGTLISFGVYFAFDWGGAIVKMTKAGANDLSWLGQLIHRTFASSRSSVDATWAVFFIPAAALLFWALLDLWLIKDTPEDAGFPHLDTHDASSGQMHVNFTAMELLKKVFTNRLMLVVAVVELTSGVFRYGIMNWYLTFAGKHETPVTQYFADHWGVILCFFGIIGGFAGGLISDKFFQSRRGPPAALLCGFVLLMSVTMAVSLKSSQFVVGSAAVLIVTAGIGITSLMSGTAATDFGGRKATATSSGIVDAFAYLGSGLQSVSLGYLLDRSWYWWPIFLMPFAVGGGIMAMKIWKELPAATKKYIEEVEKKNAPILAYGHSAVPTAKRD